MSGLIERTIKSIENRRKKILDGKVNCIPSQFKQFRYDYPGIEQGCYYLVSGSAKSSKSKITNFLFLYSSVLYAYYHPEQIRVKIFYCLLEETQENITMKFMCYLLYILSGYKIRTDIKTLKSVDKDRLVSPEIIEILKGIEYQSILTFFEDHVTFVADRNPTGIYNAVKQYAEEHGTIHRKHREGYDKEVFDWYQPDDEDEYVLCIIDHISLIQPERGFDLRKSIEKLSEYMKIIRNHYSYIPVVVQQQNSETISLEAYKQQRISPTQKGLRDSQATGLDCDVMFGITNPFSFQLPKYPNGSDGYDITKLRDCARFLEVVLGRDGVSNAMLALYFDGATGYYTPLPPANNHIALERYYNLILNNRRVN